MRIGLVILNYKTCEKTISCVESIESTYKEPKVIVVVDNASPNDSYERLTEAYRDNSEVVVVETGKNGGFSFGNNFGFNYIQAEYSDVEHVVLTNNDIIFLPETLEKLVAGFNIRDNIALTAPLILDVNQNKTNNPWKKKPTLLQLFRFKSRKGCFYEWDELSSPTPVYMVSGCCFVVSVDKYECIGKLDENVFLYNEENILSWRIASKGFGCMAIPDAPIIHDHGTTTGRSNLFVDKEYVKSSLYYCRTYEKLGRFNLLLFWMYLMAKIMMKCFCGKYASRKGLGLVIVETLESCRNLMK